MKWGNHTLDQRGSKYFTLVQKSSHHVLLIAATLNRSVELQINPVSTYHKLHSWTFIMPCHAKSDEQKTVKFSHAKQALEAAATEAYCAELEKKKQGLPSLIARAICEKFMTEHRQKTGKIITLVHTTILRHLEGKQTCAQANEAKSWLTAEEWKVVIEYIIETGVQGFPLSHKRLKEHVDEICQEKYGEEFPEKGVGK